MHRVKFTNGPLPAKDFRMIERHFFKDRLIKSFDFNFGFCIPESTNTREDMYELPSLSDDESKLTRCVYAVLFQNTWLGCRS